ncbi:MAG: carbohydrate kinase [Methylophilaceae bacterium]
MISKSSLVDAQRTVAIFGEVVADVFPDSRVLGGAPFNVGRHLQAFGLHPLFITRTGNDALRADLLAAMNAWDMDISGVQLDVEYPTGQVKVHFEEGTHRFEILADQAYDYIDKSAMLSVMQANKPELIYFGTLAQRHATSKQTLDSFLRETDALRLVDINLRAPWYDENTLEYSLEHADIVKMNEEELGIFAKIFQLKKETKEEQALNLIQRFQLQCMLITCGDQGAWLINSDGKKFNVKGSKTNNQIVDTVGAGDGFSAVYILGTLLDWPVETTLLRANEFAAAICGIRGAAPDHMLFYDAFIREWQ